MSETEQTRQDTPEADPVAAALEAGDLAGARALLAAEAETARAELESRLEAVTAERDGYAEEIRSNAIEKAVREAASAAEVDPEMVAVLVDRLTPRLDVKDGRVVVVDEAGKPVTDKSGRAKGPAELIGEMRASGALPRGFFRTGTGGGAPGNAGAGLSGMPNPWAPDSFNLTRQGELLRTNPTLARSLAAEAGKSL